MRANPYEPYCTVTAHYLYRRRGGTHAAEEDSAVKGTARLIHTGWSPKGKPIGRISRGPFVGNPPRSVVRLDGS